MAHRDVQSSPPRRQYSFRTSPSRKPRPALAPLHPNLRRLPSRTLLAMAPLKDRDADYQVGAKRKRIPSGTENYHPPHRTQRSVSRTRYKRQKQLSESERSADMDVDDDEWPADPASERDSDDDDEPELDSSDDFWVNAAPASKLSRLRRAELVRLAAVAGIEDEIEGFTKPQIAEAIVEARDTGSVPPTPGAHDPPTSPSSDDGNDGGGEETDAVNGRYPLGRRSTDPSLTNRNFRPLKGRSFSLGLLHANGKGTNKTRARAAISRTPNGFAARRYASQNNVGLWRSSPSQSVLSRVAPPSPPATRYRLRDTRKTNGKHVGFKDDVEAIVTTEDEDEDVNLAVENTPMPRRTMQMLKLPEAQPSPRRLRSKTKSTESSDSRQRNSSDSGPRTSSDAGVRRLPKRKAKEKIGTMAESDTNDDEELEEEGVVTEEDQQSADEVDQLESSRSPSPPKTPIKGRARRGRRRATPVSNSSASRSPPETVKRRLRSRGAQTYTPPSDGDDEQEEEVDEQPEAEQMDEDSELSVSESVEDGEEQDEMEESGEGEEGEEDAPVAKVLRNGKTVGDVAMEEDEGAVDESDEVVTDDTVDSEEAEEDGDANMEEDIDLEGATAKSLTRLRRDDLVRMCETRYLDVDGTKPQLVDALLQWRERQQSVHCPSSTSTARPPSTARENLPRARKHGKQGKGSTPILLRDKHVHIDEPRTPPVSSSERAKTIGGHKEEGELELDLESLGLEDREIPPDKLVKMEKIGSGGFKDVFVGKLRGRMKVAIAEFRGQLSAMDIKELKLLSDFDHPNVVRFLGVSIPENTRDTPVAMVSELCSNGDLFDYIRNVPAPSLIKVLNIALDIARGIEYLHTRKPSVIHRDCKSSNILITSKATAKIADFGLAKVKQSTRSMVVSLVGTVNWQAPELWHPHPKYNHKVDVFSCGMVYWEMLQWHLPQKKFPWEGMNEHAIYDLVGAKKQRPSVSGMRKQWCPEVVDLMERMWAQDPGDRPTMTEVVRQLEAIIRQYKP